MNQFSVYGRESKNVKSNNTMIPFIDYRGGLSILDCALENGSRKKRL